MVDWYPLWIDNSLEREVEKRMTKREEKLPRFEESHTDGSRYSFTFKSKYGEVLGVKEPMPYNCGAIIISGVSFQPSINRADVVWRKKHTEEEYDECVINLMEEFNSELDTICTFGDEHKNKIIMSDFVHVDISTFGRPCIEMMCKLTGWRAGEPTYNCNSGNYTVIFERDRFDTEESKQRNIDDDDDEDDEDLW